MNPDTDTFPHDADIGIVGRGPTVEAALVAAARAMFGLMTDLARVQPSHAVHVAFVEPDPEYALVQWLNELLARAHVAGLVLSRFALTRRGDHWSGAGAGEPWRAELERGVQVKGATFTELAVRRDAAGGYEARCVVDV